jgi:hypothetical protein
MCHRTFARSVGLLILGGFLLALNLPAQDPAPSVTEAARRARAQKKKAPKPAPIVTDDTLHPSVTTPAHPAVETAPPADPSASESATNPDSKEAAAAVDKEKKEKAEIEALKQRIAEQKKTVKLAEREINLQQDTFYSNPDYAHDNAGKDKLDAMKTDLQQKQDALADLQSKLAALGATEDSTSAPGQSKP